MRLTAQRRAELIGSVIEQILEDVRNGDVDGIYALLMDCPKEPMLGFLPAETLDYLGLDS